MSHETANTVNTEVFAEQRECAMHSRNLEPLNIILIFLNIVSFSQAIFKSTIHMGGIIHISEREQELI
jgi:hypothetical protein